MSTALLDDHLLLAMLLDEHPDLPGSDIATTGLWYHRLARALTASRVEGAMSGALGDVDQEVSRSVIEAMSELPDDVQLVSLRTLAGPMARLVADGVRLNLLSLEALAAAEHLDAEICLAEEDLNEPLVAAAIDRDVAIRVVLAS